MMKLLRTIKVNKSGASAAEYALLVALIGGVIITAASLVGGGIKGVFTKSGTELSTATGSMN